MAILHRFYCTQFLIRIMPIQINRNQTLNMNITQTSVQNIACCSMSKSWKHKDHFYGKNSKKIYFGKKHYIQPPKNNKIKQLMNIKFGFIKWVKSFLVINNLNTRLQLMVSEIPAFSLLTLTLGPWFYKMLPSTLHIM